MPKRNHHRYYHLGLCWSQATQNIVLELLHVVCANGSVSVWRGGEGWCGVAWPALLIAIGIEENRGPRPQKHVFVYAIKVSVVVLCLGQGSNGQKSQYGQAPRTTPLAKFGDRELACLPLLEHSHY